MLIKESTLRRIIREEARRALREDDAAVPTPVAAPAPVPAPAKPPLTDPALIDTMIKTRLKAAGSRLQTIREDIGKKYRTSGNLAVKFDILTTGLIDRNTITVKLAFPDTYQKEIETMFKNAFLMIRFDPIETPVIGRELSYTFQSPD
jgi:hypothetical protein